MLYIRFFLFLKPFFFFFLLLLLLLELPPRSPARIFGRLEEPVVADSRRFALAAGNASFPLARRALDPALSLHEQPARLPPSLALSADQGSRPEALQAPEWPQIPSQIPLHLLRKDLEDIRYTPASSSAFRFGSCSHSASALCRRSRFPSPPSSPRILLSRLHQGRFDCYRSTSHPLFFLSSSFSPPPPLPKAY